MLDANIVLLIMGLSVFLVVILLLDIEMAFTNPLLTVVTLGLSTNEVVVLLSVELLFVELSVDAVVTVPLSVELLFVELSVDLVVTVPLSVELLFVELSVDLVVTVPLSVELLFVELSVDLVVTVPLSVELLFAELSVDAVVAVTSALAVYVPSLTPIPKATTAIAAKTHFFPDLYIL
ncbi:hypothetical protein LBAT_1594 [Lactobacillus acetotolerans]|uniref:Uncharacterized protein n=1 Tax=Lactobacillus acetotolerans TaxID=1600 RepID=A0A0D6A5J0_9LACO|nr:hypothetical protein LBAT_1594 [Lactobacillus acetotolerans]